MIDELLARLNELNAQIKKNKAVNVNSNTTKQLVIDLGGFYFSEVKPEVLGILGDSSDLSTYDKNWQNLIRLAHENNLVTTYKKTLKDLIKTTKEISIKRHSTFLGAEDSGSSVLSYSEAEAILIDTLDKLIPSAANSYRQGIQDLKEANGRSSYRGTACEFREAFRETLDHLAPDKDVEKSEGFKFEKDRTRPTMKQKIKYILSSQEKKRPQISAAQKTLAVIEGLSGDLGRAFYNRASLSSHVETTRQEVEQLKRYMDALLFDILAISRSS